VVNAGVVVPAAEENLRNEASAPDLVVEVDEGAVEAGQRVADLEAGVEVVIDHIMITRNPAPIIPPAITVIQPAAAKIIGIIKKSRVALEVDL